MVRERIRRELKILQSVVDEGPGGLPAASRHGPERKQVSPPESSDSVEARLRKQLKDATDSRAETEKEFMNILSSLETEKRTTSELLDERTRERDVLEKKLSDLQSQGDELRLCMENYKTSHKSEMEQLEADSLERDSQLKAKCRELQDANAALEASATEKKTLKKEAIELKTENSALRRQFEEMKDEVETLKSRIPNKDGVEAYEKLIQHMRSRAESQQTEIDRLNADVAGRDTLSETRNRELEELRSDIKGKDRVNESLRSTLTTLEANDCVRDSELRTKSRQLADAQSELSTKSKENDALRMEAEELKRQHEEDRRRCDKISTEIKVLATNRDIAAKQIDEKLDRLESDVIEKDSRLEAKGKEIESQQIEIDRLNADIAGRDDVIERRNKEVEELRSDIKAKVEEIEVLRSTLTTLEADACVRDSQLQTKSRQLADAQSELATKSKESDALRMEAKELIKQHEEERRRCDEVKKEMDVLTLNRGIASQEIGEKLDRLESDVAEKDSRLEAKGKEIDILKSALKASTEQVDVLAKEEVAKRKESETLKDVLKASTDHVSALAREIEVVREKHGIETKRANDLQLQLDALTSERSATDRNNEAKDSAFRSEISRLEAELAEKDSSANALMVEIKAVESILSDSRGENDALEREVQSLREKLKVASDRAGAAEKEELKELQLRTAQKMNEHNCEVESLRRELTAANMQKAEQNMKVINLQNEIDILEKAKSAMTSELEEQLKDQTSNGLHLQSSLKAKESEIKAMRTEITNLRESMKKLTSCRRDEVKEMESELVQKSRRIAEQERSIQSLKMELKESERKFDGNAFADSIHVPIAETRAIIPIQPSAPISPEQIKGMNAIRDKQIIEELSLENNELREEVQALVAELHRLREKFRDLRDKQHSSNTVKVLRARNEALKKDVEKATRRLKSLEKSITRISC